MTYRVVVVPGENPSLRFLASESLGDDIEVVTFESANEALWEVRSRPPEVIVADTDLPEMSGVDMAGILPNFGVPTRIILCSQNENPQMEREAMAFGTYRFLHGAYSQQTLHEAIREAIQSMPETAIDPEEETDTTPETVADTVERAPQSPAPPPVKRPNPQARGRLAARASGLVARTRAHATQARAPRPVQATPEPEPETEIPPLQYRPRSGNLVLTNENLSPIRTIMSQLSQELGPQCILLTDRAGMVLVEVGSTDKLPVMILLPLLSTSFATSGEVARQLGEEDATTLYIHEGVNYDLYCFDIAQRFLLVLVFNKKVASSKIGAVWVNTKRAIRDLHDALLSGGK